MRYVSAAVRKYVVCGVVLLMCGLFGCTLQRDGYRTAPPAHQTVDVANGVVKTVPLHNFYVVQKDDSLVSIALYFGLDVRELVKINHLQSPYEVHFGQIIKLFVGTDADANKFLATKKVTHWLWPASGTVVQTFSREGIVPNNGIDIAGRMGDPIFATAGGKVVYCGSGLSSYGKLIIIKHNDSFVSTYAMNKNIFVSEGQFVKAGQRIAEMGANSAERAMLHFEIRHNSTPIDPLHLLRTETVH